MNYRNHQILRAEINRIAALKIEDKHTKALRDRILIGYTYFLDSLSYLTCYKVSESEHAFILIERRMKISPLHPILCNLFKEWDDNIEPIDFPMAKELIKNLSPHPILEQLPDFDDPIIRWEAIQTEGLTDEHMKILSLFHLPLHLEAVMIEPPFELSDEHKDTKRLEESKAALEEFFNNHPFFEHLKIRLNKN
jgi:hypothetical protein